MMSVCAAGRTHGRPAWKLFKTF